MNENNNNYLRTINLTTTAEEISNSGDVKKKSLYGIRLFGIFITMIRILAISLLNHKTRFQYLIAISCTTVSFISSGGVVAEIENSGSDSNNSDGNNRFPFINNRFPSYGYETQNSSLGFNYLVIAPEFLQPDSIFRVIVHTFVKDGESGRKFGNEVNSDELHLSVSIMKDGLNLETSRKIIRFGELESTDLLIPPDLKNGSYKLIVEGNHPESSGGTIFNHASNLTYSEKFLSILIQTSRRVYNGDGIVRFRCILLQRNLRPYGHPVEVYILDPRGFVMRKWPSVAPQFGVVELSYALPSYSATGYWKIRVEAGAQTEDKIFQVDKYFKHLYEVMVSMPPFLLATDETFTATVSPFYGTEKGVIGNGTVKIFGKSKENPDWLLFGTELFLVDRSYDVTWELKNILRAFGNTYSTHNVVIRVEANVTDFLVGETRSGFAESRIIHQNLQLEFISPTPLIFKPGLSFQTYIKVSYSDHQHVPSTILETSHLRVTAESHFQTGGNVDSNVLELSPVSQSAHRLYFGNNEFTFLDQRSRFEEYAKKGLALVKFKVPKKTDRLILRADYSDSSGNHLTIQKRIYPYFSPTSKFINVICTKNSIVVGEYATLQFGSTFYLEDFHYIVMSKGLILQHGTEQLPNAWSLSKTFSIPVSPNMSPGFRMIVYHVTQNGEILSDMVYVPVEGLSRHRVKFVLNEAKDKLKDSVEAGFVGDAGSYIALSAHRSIRYFLQAGDELNVGGVLQNLYSLEPSYSKIGRVLSRDWNGVVPDQIQYLQTQNSGIDIMKTFSASHLLLFGNGRVHFTFQKEQCDGRESCGSESCFSFINHCGKIMDCGDLSPEPECEISEEELVEYRVNRTNHVFDFYDPIPDGDWAWASGNIGPHGNTYLTLNVPKITDTWHVTSFAITPKHGFSLIEPVIQYDSTRPFLMALDAPPSIRRGEQVGIITILSNNTPKDIFVTVILHASPDYTFVKLGNTNGNVDEGKIELIGEEYHHFLWIPAQGQIEVRIPVKPTIEQGTIEVKLSAITQIRSDSGTLQIDVLPEGAQIGKHTSFVLDLKNRATVPKFMNIWVEQSPLNPRDPLRKYIYGSPAGHVTMYGDIIGPIFPTIPVTMENLIGKSGQGTADRLFDLSVNIWSLHYLRLTNQLKMPLARKVFVEMNKSFAYVMRRFETNETFYQGSFRMWDSSSPTVWLSAWALQIFMHGTFQDWENYFVIENRILANTTAWLIRNQNLDGTFGEHNIYQRRPLNKKMHDGIDTTLGPYNISLTAHVAIALHLVSPHLDGSLKLSANLAKYRAIRYLEKHLNEVTDAYQAAILTYFLTLVDSPEKDAAFIRLFSLRIEDAEFLYWSPGPIPKNVFIYENARPFIQPKNSEYWDSVAVEATSYALMVCLMRDGVTLYAEQIVAWLNTMKLTDGSFISTLDTAVAFQALAEYGNRARLRDITHLSVAIEVSSTNGTVGNIRIDPDTIVIPHVIQIPEVWGHVNVIASGSGQAVVQLDVTYGVEWDELKDTPPKPCFDLKVREFFSVERNRTALTIESCFRWTLLEESLVSGAAVVEIEIPTGYSLVMSDALEVVASGIHPTLHDVLISPGKTSWYFDYIAAEWSCFNHTVRRWYPVANLTIARQASIYEAYALERFQNVITRDASMKELSICHVCGSFQCPYCPYFSGSHNLLHFSSPFIYFTLVFLIVTQNLSFARS